MTDDIITKLQFLKGCNQPSHDEIAEAAADEIKRLRAENTRLSSFLHPVGAVTNLRCDCNRYRPCRHCAEARRG